MPVVPSAIFADPWSKNSRFEFSGNAKEYFGIWIVNILLTILTLGIYSAWAKVRRNRYFYGNTRLLGSGFDYHAQPIQILKGRIIALVVIILLNVLSNLFPLLGLFLALLLFAALPAIIVRGLRFNARMSSYRNVRFGFSGSYWGAAKAYIAGPLLAIFTFGLMVPFASKWSAQYLFNNLHYGNKSFRTSPKLRDIYGAWFFPAAVAFICLLLVASLFFIESRSAQAFASLAVLFMIGLYAALAIAGLFYFASVRNIALNATLIDDKHRLVSNMPPFEYAYVVITNIIATICTIGLLRPWAAVRMAKFQANHTAVDFEGDLGEVFSAVKSDESAFGGEFMDLEGISVGL